MKYLLFVLLILAALSGTAFADDVTTVRNNLESKLNAVLDVMGQEDLDSNAKQNRVVEIVEPLFDFALMSYYALGKTTWSGLSSEDKKRFTNLFTRILKETYLPKLTLFTNAKITFETPIDEKNKIHIPTHVFAQDENMSLVFKFIKRNNDWRIYDVETEGVSIISSNRSQFNETLQSGTFDELLKTLEDMKSDQ
ncbi:MAG: ABC transporter substrate-binding protein [Deltaproteobacteria bacterium]|nr:ABC transporter substrate-binding protein [Deltaproteobacteria bacterium]